MKKERVRRRRIPAFGEWNYDHDGDGGGGGGCYGYGYRDGDWPIPQYFDSAMQARGLVISLPPSPKPAKKAVKWIDSGALGVEEVDEKQRQRQHKVVVGLAVAAAAEHGGARKQGKQSRVADAGAHAATGYSKAYRPAVNKAVDQDVYEIPPDMLCPKPRVGCTLGDAVHAAGAGNATIAAIAVPADWKQATLSRFATIFATVAVADQPEELRFEALYRENDVTPFTLVTQPKPSVPTTSLLADRRELTPRAR